MAMHDVTIEKTILALLDEKKYQTLKDILVTMEPTDIVAIFEELSEDYQAPISDGLEEGVIMRLRSAVREIGEPCRTIIRRRFYDDWQYRDIALRLGVDVNQVGVRIQRCLKTLKMLISVHKVTAEDIP